MLRPMAEAQTASNREVQRLLRSIMHHLIQNFQEKALSFTTKSTSKFLHNPESKGKQSL